MQTLTEPTMQKPFEAGNGIELKNLDDKILISAKCTTRLKEGNFLIEGDSVEIRAGHGIKISSIHPNILVVSADTAKQEEKIFDFNKRLETVEKSLVSVLNILKALKVTQ
jgi:hypothetical protein